MSLINDMLRDLEERQHPDDRKTNLVAPSLSRTDQPSSRGAKLAATLGGLLLLAAGTIWWWPAPSHNSPAIVTAPAMVELPSKTAALPETAPSATAQEQPANDATAADTQALPAVANLEPTNITAPDASSPQITTPQHSQTPNGLAQHNIRRLLTAAEQALAKNRLTTPLNDNAYDYYQAVLASYPNHPEAQHGVQQIVDRYRRWAEAAYRDGDVARALGYLQRSLLVRPEDAALLALRQRYKAQPNPETAPNTETAAITTAPPAPWRITKQQARQKLSQGDLAGAQTLLESDPPAVADDPAYHALLAGIYHKTGQHRQAAAMYQTLVAFEPDVTLHWLGLAVALDALRDRDGALRAFKRARDGSNNRDVRNYIDQRIAALNNDATARATNRGLNTQ